MRFLIDALVTIAVPGGAFYGMWRLVKYVRNRRMRPVMTAREVMDAMADRFPDDEWKRLYREAVQQPETLYEASDKPTGWRERAKLMMQTRWPRA